MGKAVSFGIGVFFLAATISTPSCVAQVVTGESSSSSSSSQTVVDKKSYAFKYKQRLKDWTEQINTGLSKGWLSADAGQKMRDRVAALRTLEASVRAKGYPKADLDDMEKQFTQFNIDLSHASETKPAAATDSGKSTSVKQKTSEQK